MTSSQGEGSAPSVEALCALAGVSRASYYRRWREHAPKVEETGLRDRVQRLCLANRFYGYRRITALLRREGWCAAALRRCATEPVLIYLSHPRGSPQGALRRGAGVVARHQTLDRLAGRRNTDRLSA